MVEERCIWGEAWAGASVDCIQVKMLAWVTNFDEKSKRRKPKDSYATVIGVGLVGT